MRIHGMTISGAGRGSLNLGKQKRFIFLFYLPIPPHDSDDEKVDSTFRKLAKMQLDKDDHLAAAATLRTLVDRLTGEKKISEAWRSLAQTLSAVSNLPEEYTPKVVSGNCTNIYPLRSLQLHVGNSYLNFIILKITLSTRKQRYVLIQDMYTPSYKRP